MTRIYYSKLMPFFPKSKEPILLLDKGSINERFYNLYQAVVGSHCPHQSKILDNNIGDEYINFGLLDLLIFPLLSIPLSLLSIYLKNAAFSVLDILTRLLETKTVVGLILFVLFPYLFSLFCILSILLSIAENLLNLVRITLGVIISTLLYPFLCLNNYDDNYPRLWFELRELGIVKFELSELQQLTPDEIKSFKFFETLCDYRILSGQMSIQGEFNNMRGIKHGSNTIFLANSNMQAFSLIEVEKIINRLRCVDNSSFEALGPATCSLDPEGLPDNKAHDIQQGRNDPSDQVAGDRLMNCQQTRMESLNGINKVKNFTERLIVFINKSHREKIIPFINFLSRLSRERGDELTLLPEFLNTLFTFNSNNTEEGEDSRLLPYCMALLIGDYNGANKTDTFLDNGFLHSPNKLFDIIKDNSPFDIIGDNNQFDIGEYNERNKKYLRWNVDELNSLARNYILK